MYLMMAAIGPNMWSVQTDGVFIPKLCQMNNNRNIPSHIMMLQYYISMMMVRLGNFYDTLIADCLTMWDP
jgi:hypothetical protein